VASLDSNCIRLIAAPFERLWDSQVRVMTSYGLDDRDSIPSSTVVKVAPAWRSFKNAWRGVWNAVYIR